MRISYLFGLCVKGRTEPKPILGHVLWSGRVGSGHVAIGFEHA